MTLRLLCVLAHPDDESLGTGGALARYGAEGVETHLLTATRGEAGRYRDGTDHPGPETLGRIREEELRRAASVLGVRRVEMLGYPDGGLDGVDPAEAVGRIAAHVREIRPHVVVTFDPYGAYGHPDHVAVCQLATAATVAAADPDRSLGGSAPPHGVSKLYYMAWPADVWDAYQATFKKLVSTVDGVERQAAPWPEWAITTVVDTADHWPTVWEAVRCHETQMEIYGALGDLDEAHHRALWGRQSYYRAFSTVNGGRARERDLFEGLR